LQTDQKSSSATSAENKVEYSVADTGKNPDSDLTEANEKDAEDIKSGQIDEVQKAGPEESLKLEAKPNGEDLMLGHVRPEPRRTELLKSVNPLQNKPFLLKQATTGSIASKADEDSSPESNISSP